MPGASRGLSRRGLLRLTAAGVLALAATAIPVETPAWHSPRPADQPWRSSTVERDLRRRSSRPSCVVKAFTCPCTRGGGG
ncbi:twin-arginine translocation signal domain-containing protein, partial [Amycolatopsis sp. CA-126428]|uniref:twin-arginine translocation signal domain-containing protein n=1 Tax=Amycolatopsis sp. CA-126428 TaxID=2073158 RepID=UPI003516CE9C